MAPPKDAIAAVTHPDPYPYYAELIRRGPMHRDESLGLWVACGADAVRAVLTSERCRVRPAAEPVPPGLVGSAAGEIFRHLVRMTDGPRHFPLKRAVSVALASVDPGAAAAQSRRSAELLAGEIDAAGHPERLADFAFRLPVHVMASLVGVAPGMLDRVAGWMSDFVRCLAPGGAPEQMQRGIEAAGHLRETFHALLTDGRSPGLVAGLARSTGEHDADLVVANAIGYVSQAYEATAGLIGNTLVALGRNPEARATVAARPTLLEPVIREVVRYDAPVQNTRRFVDADAIVAGQPMRQGDRVLVVLAAANRDPSANPHPDGFDLTRRDRQAFTFGVGAHACPGEAMAVAIAQAGIERLLTAGVEPGRLAGAVAYRPSANTRIPLFAPSASDA